MELIERNLLFFVVTLTVGIIPHKVQVHNKSSKGKGRNIELEAYLWQFTCTEQDWCLHITGMRLLNRRMRDKLDR